MLESIFRNKIYESNILLVDRRWNFGTNTKNGVETSKQCVSSKENSKLFFCKQYLLLAHSLLELEITYSIFLNINILLFFLRHSDICVLFLKV
jgi:hypothetical protein